jgi:hypothetical protein
MGSAGDYLEQKILDLVFGATAYSIPGTVYIALFTAAPTDVDGSGTEVTGGSYVRLAVTNNKTTWTNASGTTPTSLQNNIDFVFVTATANWGTVTHFAIYDAVSGGHELGWGALATSRVVNTGDTPKFLAGSVVITLD